MDSYRIVMSGRAYADLEAIHEYISRDSADKASAQIEKILESIKKLTLTPHHNIARKIKGPRPTRTLPVSSYIVYYEVFDSGRVVRILRIRHGAQRQLSDLD